MIGIYFFRQKLQAVINPRGVFKAAHKQRHIDYWDHLRRTNPDLTDEQLIRKDMEIEACIAGSKGPFKYI